MANAGHGTFCWAEVAAIDGRAARRFYTGLFGWTPRDLDTGRGWTYTVFETDQEAIAGLYEIGSVQRAKGATPAWHAYVLVDDVEAAVLRVLDLGGGVLTPPIEVSEIGLMAVARDPQGAVFCLWQEPSTTAASTITETRLNRICWNDLLTSDPSAAAAFYGDLFGWTAVPRTDGDGEAVDFLLNGLPVAGMQRIRPADDGVTRGWVVAIAVADIDFSLRRAVRLGGRVIAKPVDRIGLGRIAFLGDPDTAPLAILRLIDND